MPKYIYKAKKGPQELVEGEIEAFSREEAVNNVVEQGLVPVSVIEKSSVGVAGHSRGAGKKRPKSAFFSHKRFSSCADLDKFTRQLLSLIKGKVPLLRALSLISEQSGAGGFKEMVNKLVDEVRNGRPLSAAMAAYPKVFNNLYVNIIRAGELSGALDSSLANLSQYLEREQEIKRKIQAAVAYPIFIVIVGALTVTAMVTVFLPKMIGLFKGMNQELPLPTKILIGISSFLSAYWGWILLAFGFILLIFGRIVPAGRKKFLMDIIKLHTPVIKNFVRNAEFSRFARTLGLLLGRGILVYEGVNLAISTLENEALRKSLTKASEDIVSAGRSLSESLRRARVFPDFIITMIAVGEEGGRLEEALLEVAEVYDREVEQEVKVVTSLLEPLLILVVGGVVGFIVFAMLLPIFNLGSM